MHTPSVPEVPVRGFPVLTQLAAGTLRHVDLTARHTGERHRRPASGEPTLGPSRWVEDVGRRQGGAGPLGGGDRAAVLPGPVRDPRRRDLPGHPPRPGPREGPARSRCRRHRGGDRLRAVRQPRRRAGSAPGCRASRSPSGPTEARGAVRRESTRRTG
ncbi:hypothetical protein [Streptomyces sp. 3213.3]|uniref:hypothetical protein n=1 Tax=Streptomyces sp. 3213.3 TaxID=1855348 RepID=UPI001F476FC9|nr:hypothetical protein [Streptomyces sp. 3213.3]